MKISFIYKNNTFNFELKKDVSIISLKNKVSKLIQKDKSSFDLIYKDKILSENNSYLSNIAKNETNIPIVVSLKDTAIKKYNPRNNELEFPLLSLSNQSNQYKTGNEDADNNIKLNLNESEISINSSSKELNTYSKGNIVHFKSSKKLKYITRNKVFEDIYNKKEENIITLLQDLKNKILEYDDVLYQNFKNKIDKNNKQLLLYENNILKFKDKQIKFLKKLVNYFNKTEASFFSVGKINLEDFYQELFNYCGNVNSNNFIQNYSVKIEKKIINNNIKPVNYSEEKFPKIPNIKKSEKILLKSITLTKKLFPENNDNDDEIIEEKKDKYLVNKKQNKEKKNELKVKQIFRNNTEPELNLENTHTKEKNQKKEEEEEKAKKLITEIKEELSEENSKEEKKVVNPDKKPRSNKLKISHRDKPILDKNKINVIFDITENKDEIIEDTSDNESSIDNVKEKKSKKRQIIERNLKERKRSMIVKNTNSNIGYKSKLRDRKTTFRLKKLGNNFSDFII